MELKRYVMILWQWWWVLLVSLITVVISTILFTYTTQPMYEASVRFIVRPAPITTTDLKEVRSSIASLDKPTVANTYSEIAQSPSNIQATWNALKIKPQSDYKIRSSVLQQTNIIIITVSGPDPRVVVALANTAGKMTLEYVSQLYEIYDLALLDPAVLPTKPISPNKQLNLIMGIVIGLGLGLVLSFLAAYLQTPFEQANQSSIIDAQTGAYKTTYFVRRIRSEISRAQRVQRPFVMAFLRLENFDDLDLSVDSQQVLIKQIVTLIRQSLTEENLITQWKKDTLAFLMPDFDAESAIQALKQIQTKLAWTVIDVAETGLKLTFNTSLGVVTYDLSNTTPEVLLAQAEKSLEEVELPDEQFITDIQNV